MMILRLFLVAAVVATTACDDDGARQDQQPAGAGTEEVAEQTPPRDPSGQIPPILDEAPADSSTVGDTANLAGSSKPDASPAAPVTDGAAQEPPLDGNDAVAILLRAERAYEAVRSMRADFIQDLEVPLLASSQRSRGEIFHRKPDRFLMRFSDPEGDVVVADGRYVWLYYPSSDPKQVVRTSIGQAGRLDLQREFLSNPTERFEASLQGTDTVDGRQAHALTLVPTSASPYRQVRIWVDAQDALVRRFEITENNEAVRTVELHNLRVNVPLGDELFSFTPPAGTQVFDQ